MLTPAKKPFAVGDMVALKPHLVWGNLWPKDAGGATAFASFAKGELFVVLEHGSNVCRIGNQRVTGWAYYDALNLVSGADSHG